jgi:hypothetical protein
VDPRRYFLVVEHQPYRDIIIIIIRVLFLELGGWAVETGTMPDRVCRAGLDRRRVISKAPISFFPCAKRNRSAYVRLPKGINSLWMPANFAGDFGSEKGGERKEKRRRVSQ